MIRKRLCSVNNLSEFGQFKNLLKNKNQGQLLRLEILWGYINSEWFWLADKLFSFYQYFIAHTEQLKHLLIPFKHHWAITSTMDELAWCWDEQMRGKYCGARSGATSAKLFREYKLRYWIRTLKDLLIVNWNPFSY